MGATPGLGWAPVLLLLTICPAHAEDEAWIAASREITDTELDQRLAFIETRLNRQQRNADYWRNGWTGFYSLSSAGQSVAAFAANDSDGQVYWGVGAVKAAGGLAQVLLKPLAAVESGHDFRALPARSRDERLAKLRQGETMLRANAAQATERFTWRRRAIGTIGNLVGGVVIAAFGEDGAAVISTLLGLGVHEATIWTQPAGAAQDLEDYRKERWAGQAARPGRWRIAANPAGVTLHVRF
ncbi:MAG: hypothetical protein PVG38_12225 [Gammaproteobacteria bacterium]|jgi:hypothetical protein